MSPASVSSHRTNNIKSKHRSKSKSKSNNNTSSSPLSSITNNNNSTASKWHKDRRTIRYVLLALGISAVVSFATIRRHTSGQEAPLPGEVGSNSNSMGGNLNLLQSSSSNNNSNNNKMGGMTSKSTNENRPPDLNSFAYSLFHEISTSPQQQSSPNVLLSPFSIASALGMVLAGTTPNGKSQLELSAALNVNSHSDLPLLSKHVLSSTNDGKEGVEFNSGNGIWSKSSLQPSYVHTVESVHQAIARPLPSAFDPINEFISERTHGRIRDLMPPNEKIDPLTVALLVNAVYFKGTWRVQFDEGLTRKGEFKTYYGEDGRVGDTLRVVGDAMMMYMKRKMMVAEEVGELGGATVVCLEYGKGEEDSGVNSKGMGIGDKEGEKKKAEFGALFLLPKENTPKSMDEMFKSLSTLSTSSSSSSLSQVLQNKLDDNTMVELTLPRFKLSYGTASIKPHLNSLGINSIFQPDPTSPPLLSMSSDPELYLDDVYHKAEMEVTEEGTVASAATMAVVMTRSFPPRPVEVRFDRPFGMVVVHLESMTPLFVARVGSPEFLM